MTDEELDQAKEARPLAAAVVQIAGQVDELDKLPVLQQPKAARQILADMLTLLADLVLVVEPRE